MLVVPSPNLPLNNDFDVATHEAIKNFKKQFNRQRGKKIVEDGSITIGLWKYIGQSLVRFDNGMWLTNEYIRVQNSGDFELYQLLKSVPDSTYTDSMRRCDEKLAEILGGEGAVVSSIIDPKELKKADGSPRNGAGEPRLYGHNAIACNELLETNDRGGIIHLFANEQGLPGDVGVYAPAGFIRVSSVKGERGETVKLLPKEDNQQYFYNNNKLKPLYIVYSHVKTDGVSGIGEKKDNGSVKIGNIGGPNGVSITGDYAHIHIVFFSKYFGHPFTGTRVDPRGYFCI